MFVPVTVPGQGEEPTPQVLLAEIESWVRSEALHALVRRFGNGRPAGNLAEVLAFLDAFTATAWDFRSANSVIVRERNQTNAGAITGADEEFVFAATEALGLLRPRPPKYSSYDHVVVLGGLVPSNILRPAYAAHLLRNGITCSDVTAISAYRELARNTCNPENDEYEMLKVFGLSPRSYEWEVMEEGLRQAFALPDLTVRRESEPGAAGPGRFRVASAQMQEFQVHLVVSPALEPGRRANTADGYRYWVEQIGNIKPGDRVLAVTTSIYVPYQHAVAILYLGLPFGCSIDTVGIDFSIIKCDRNLPPFRGVHYLQETRSALRAYRQLVAVLEDRFPKAVI